MSAARYEIVCPQSDRALTTAQIVAASKSGICPDVGPVDQVGDQDLALGFCGFLLLLCWAFIAMGRRTRRRNQRPLPPPDDPRLRNVVSLRDWKRRGGHRLHPGSPEAQGRS